MSNPADEAFETTLVSHGIEDVAGGLADSLFMVWISAMTAGVPGRGVSNITLSQVDVRPVDGPACAAVVSKRPTTISCPSGKA
ncbi:MAG: hypothetical protein GVY06_06970 [Alphaproteobacteria bacterium]|jgi:hypothetical protein|nr:hypothetical protein [Alphaproteobacteria bacterium]